MPVDREKALERQHRYRAKMHSERFGDGAGDMRGRHGNHARGEHSGHWNGGRWMHGDGYVAIAVPDGHHLRQKNGYAYEHQLVAEKMLGRRLEPDEVVHHRNGKRDDNRPANLEVTTRSEHARDHVSRPGTRDSRGRFNNAPRH